MLINTTLAEGAWVAASACVGVFLIAVSVEGYLFAPMAAWLRIIAAAGSLLLIKPGMETDAIGLAVLILVLLLQKKKEKSALAA